ncbi:hypothetical protein [Methyloceanibacter caenitepidi]|uniref:DUF2066 domain-containing protein n=1 Tax=Methyloceanibacter caenitepidi TaxID=1384459 RepID=A0A0A8K788_9HYPH|nr:hypothetical protein [Methyloceanibacter caenitepidi]BAQ17849.1 hypothetical protein GL4_2413 [Methyloceanibacter caenitepidi]
MTLQSANAFRGFAGRSAKLSRLALLGAGMLLGIGVVSSDPARAASLFNVANVRVDVTAKDAVVAREKGMAKAETLAMQILLERLAPPSWQHRLPSFSHREIEGLVAGIAIHSEKTSARRYIGVVDVRFYPGAVRQLLTSRSIPFVESQASPISILPVMLEDDFIAKGASTDWRQAWARLDLDNGVAPAELATLRDDLEAGTIKAVLAGDESAYAALRSTYGYGGLVVAVGQVADGLFRIHLVGEDAAGDVDAVATSAVDRANMTATEEQAARLGLNILERRWKQRLDPTFDETADIPLRRGALYPEEAFTVQDEALGRVGAVIEFFSVSDWQQIHFGLQRVADIRDFEIVSRSARGAEVVFDYEGSADQLQAVLAQNGIGLYERDGTLVIRAMGP